VVSILERLGQEQAIRDAVDDFYERVVGDSRPAHHFDGVDLCVLRGHQSALLIRATGGPAEYSGRDLAVAHAQLGITPDDVDRVVGHLVATLTSSGVAAGDIGAGGEALTGHRDEIVTAPMPV
jgi:hemoglobin